jgi:hypothetical protein
MATISVNAIARALAYQSYDSQQNELVSPTAALEQHDTLVT